MRQVCNKRDCYRGRSDETRGLCVRYVTRTSEVDQTTREDSVVRYVTGTSEVDQTTRRLRVRYVTRTSEVDQTTREDSV